ncbi:MAG: ImmA/IrrE family metallo-endopeptidase, partial [Pseudohongiellaceae bacterium]
MISIYPIHNDNDYQQVLGRLEQLLESDPADDTDAAAELEVLATLLEKYEAEHFSISPPTPLEAIRFRMEQMGLKSKDLVPYIGSASKVSEVLNGKRSLSLNMIRNLNRHLDISAEVLIQDESGPEALRSREKFLRNAGIRETSPAYVRSTAHYRQNKDINREALLAWRGRVLIRSREREIGEFDAAALNDQFFDHVAMLSVFDEGPRLAREFIEQHGIAVVLEKQLPKTCLDGAALLRDDGAPVVGLTLRHDKLDNFWFTLMHELVHVRFHLSQQCDAIFDDLSQSSPSDAIERDADEKAGEILIPATVWRKASVRKSHTPADALALAHALKRHPSIVVGRLQNEENDYSLLAKSIGIGRNTVRRQF